MLIEDKIKALAPNIQEVVKAVLGNKKIQVYGFTDGFTGTNEESLAIIDDQLNAFKLHVSNSKEKVLVSIASWAKQKQIYKITIIGRENTYFQDKVITAFIFFPDTFPQKPPIVVFEDVKVNGTYETYQHVNVFSSGQLCQAIMKSAFKQTIHIKDFLLTIEDTLYNPNPGDPANGKLANLSRTNKTEYDNVIRRQAEHLPWVEVEEDDD